MNFTIYERVSSSSKHLVLALSVNIVVDSQLVPRITGGNAKVPVLLLATLVETSLGFVI
jgi:hypothetical protein